MTRNARSLLRNQCTEMNKSSPLFDGVSSGSHNGLLMINSGLSWYALELAARPFEGDPVSAICSPFPVKCRAQRLPSSSTLWLMCRRCSRSCAASEPRRLVMSVRCVFSGDRVQKCDCCFSSKAGENEVGENVVEAVHLD